MACEDEKNSVTVFTNNFSLLDSNKAAQAVSMDTTESFFEKIRPLEIQIQSKNTIENSITAYKKLLSEDVSSFNEFETKAVSRHFRKALEWCQNVFPSLELPLIQLIKTKATYYGDGTYYTRQNSIIIPENVLEFEDNAWNMSFIQTMLHEIFHIYSRYHPKKRDEVYARIGFKKIENLILSDFLDERILHNPDGVDVAYAIALEDSTGRQITAIPAIFSNKKSYSPTQPYFFNYLSFQLFEVEQKQKDWFVVAENLGHEVSSLKNFWEQIGDNTKYIIHPDEICADNFVAIIQLRNDIKKESEFSKIGLQLLLDLEKILQ